MWHVAHEPPCSYDTREFNPGVKKKCRCEIVCSGKLDLARATSGLVFPAVMHACMCGVKHHHAPLFVVCWLQWLWVCSVTRAK